MDNKKERFKRLAAKRTNEVLKRLKILGNCANRYAYEYTNDEIKKIFDTVEEELKRIKAKFYSEVSKEKREFKL